MNSPTNPPQDAVERVELLPCPFCGFDPELTLRDYTDADANYGDAYVGCPQCLVEQPYKRTADEAIGAWNTRMGRDAIAVAFLLKPDEEMVARALHEHEWAGQPKPDNFSVDRDYWIAAARAAIKAITLAPSEER